MTERLENGTLNGEGVDTRIKIISHAEKLLKLAIMVKLGEAKFGKAKFQELRDANMVGGGSIVSTQGSLELDMINCPDQDKHITRGQCLDYSGETKHSEDCATCENFLKTRSFLLPNAQ